jgi:hypothetical protein
VIVDPLASAAAIVLWLEIAHWQSAAADLARDECATSSNAKWLTDRGPEDCNALARSKTPCGCLEVHLQE